MFSVGAVIWVFSLLRVMWLFKLDIDDPTYSYSTCVIYSALEPALGVINACVPTIKPAINRLSSICTNWWTRKEVSVATTSGLTASGEPNGYRTTYDSFSDNHLSMERAVPPHSIHELQRLDGTLGTGDGIIVTRQWEVTVGSQSHP
ncbi:hypothetical protein F5Y00DRAFT_271026 [Daldinia vernicosa]|uniref:uncharacterized protein n=1 Tax=Daldinia vernicosa TaxID=114800 RepID=UPI0020079028|nr:uncharacterized protein F5Y00DRAFT_271026 [Daldinia vernicosa]KAI0847687.1 hypothetical protein F5Y00DRAFT_271026 [Daldinia vernicosa]